MVIPAFVEMDVHQMEEGGNWILPRNIWSTPFDEMKVNATKDMKTTT